MQKRHFKPHKNPKKRVFSIKNFVKSKKIYQNRQKSRFFIKSPTKTTKKAHNQKANKKQTKSKQTANKKPNRSANLTKKSVDNVVYGKICQGKVKGKKIAKGVIYSVIHKEVPQNVDNL